MTATIAAGGAHSLGLLDNGRVIGWGYNEYGQIDDPEGNSTRFIQVAAKGNHSLGLLDNGRVIGWGSNKYGQLDVPEPPPGTSFIQVATGFYHSLGIWDALWKGLR